MPIKRGGRAIVLDGLIIDAVEARKVREKAGGSLTGYIEDVLKLFAGGLLRKFDPAEEDINSRIGGIYEELVLLRRSLEGVRRGARVIREEGPDEDAGQSDDPRPKVPRRPSK